jgi:hypothetical protein
VPFLRQQNDNAMTRREETLFDRFVRLTETDPDMPDFPAACRRLGVLPGELDEAVFRELGVGGETFMLGGLED